MTDVQETGRDFFTKEAVGGELLGDRLAQGPLAPEEALRYAVSLGNLLHRAHSQRQVHGAVSPWSVALTVNGPVLLAPGGAQSRFAAYRSPEQVRGEEIDWRTDIFSYGAVLYELAGGRRAFEEAGEALDQAILERPPAALLSKSPIAAAMEGVIAGCLEKDPARRRQRIQNAVIELKLATPPRLRSTAAKRRPRVSPPPAWEAPPPQPHTNGMQRRFLIGMVVTLLLAASGVGAALMLHQRASVPAVMKFPVNTPENATYPGTPTISPDGRYLAFSAVGPEGQRMLWLRALDEMHARIIPGTEGGFAPFWSPDSQVIGFFADRSLKTWKLSLNEERAPGGTAQRICDAGALPGGGTWNRDGIILFAPDLSNGLYRVNATGGKPQPVLALDRNNGFHSYRWPQFMPDGKHFLFLGLTEAAETSGVYTGALDSDQARRLFASQTNAVYSPEAGTPSAKSGYLLYVQDRNVMAQAFSPSALQTEGDPILFANDIGAVQSLSLAPVSVSANAVLVYQSVSRPTRQLVWMDRSGRQIAKAAEPSDWGPPRISPDGKRIVVGRPSPDGSQTDLWILGDDGAARQLTFEHGASSGAPIWSPDSSRIAFWCNADKAFDLYVQPASGPGKEPLYRSAWKKFTADWSRDGKYVLFSAVGDETKSDIWAVSLPDRRAAAIIDTIHAEGYPALSPDGRWLAYQSDESGQNQVYVQPFEGLSGGTKHRWQVSVEGGGLPRWRADGGELYFLTGPGALMAVAVHPMSGEFAFDPPHMLFQTRPIPKQYNLYDVAPDGQRFLMNIPMEWTNSSPITVMTSWTEKLKH